MPYSLKPLFTALAETFCGPHLIEQCAREALLEAEGEIDGPSDFEHLPKSFLDVMRKSDAHPVCGLIAQAPFDWVPPTTSGDPLYIKHSIGKVHVELLGPDGLVKSEKIRMGLYGLPEHFEYGNRTHPAEEIFVMLAGEAYWSRDNAPYLLHRPNEVSHHPSMMPHATATRDVAFMSAYAWCGDLSTDNYIYHGRTEGS